MRERESGRLEGLVTLVGTALSEWKCVKEKRQSRTHSGREELCTAQCPGAPWVFVLEFLREVGGLTSERVGDHETDLETFC